MRKVTVLMSTLALAAAACTGTVVGEPDEQVATLELRADTLGALQATACLPTYGESGCSRYPNPLECDTMKITVRRDGQTCAVCTTNGQRLQVCGGITDGLPVVCHATEDLACQQCADVYGNTVVDTCNRNTQLWRAPGGGWSQLPDTAGYLEEPGVPEAPPATPPSTPPSTPPTTPPGGGNDKCDASQARLKFAAELNKVLSAEGLGLTYAPLLDKKLDLGGFWGFLGFGGYKGDMCKYWLSNNSYMTQCWSGQPGKCFCKCPAGARPTCRCSRMTIAALRAACQAIPADCDYKTWVGAYVVEYGSASAWLSISSYGGGYFGNLPSIPGTPPTTPGNPVPPTCLGSPLVLDLGDDGIAPTAAEQGVNFDLLGHGAVRTAWIQGNDALLVLDRNNNGLIDDGTELFGEATDIGGAPAADGFEALATLDRPEAGGNGNGLLEAGDLMFDQLALWTDRNGDGRSQPEELQSLAQAGIRSVGVHGTTAGDVTDPHGNDLSLRGSFSRADGRRGLVVDVLFRLR